MRHLAALAAFVVMVPITVIRAQSGDVATAITKLENDGVKADLAGDTKSFTEKYVADDWVGCDSSGKWYHQAGSAQAVYRHQEQQVQQRKIE